MHVSHQGLSAKKLLTWISGLGLLMASLVLPVTVSHGALPPNEAPNAARPYFKVEDCSTDFNGGTSGPLSNFFGKLSTGFTSDNLVPLVPLGSPQWQAGAGTIPGPSGGMVIQVDLDCTGDAFGATDISGFEILYKAYSPGQPSDPTPAYELLAYGSALGVGGDPAVCIENANGLSVKCTSDVVLLRFKRIELDTSKVTVLETKLEPTSLNPRVLPMLTISYPPVSPPVSPTGVSASVVGSGQASLSWTASTGATGYTVTSSPAGATCTVVTTTATCTGLTNGTAYIFSVSATNSGGSSTPAAAAAVTPLAVPGSPTDAAATGGAGSAAVTWTAPTNNSTNVPGTYTVTASPGGQTCTATHPTVTCSVSGLTAGTYTFAVTATNVGGTSAASISTSSVTVTAGAVSNNNGNSSGSTPPAPQIDLSGFGALGSSGSNGSGGALATASAGQTFTLTGTGMNNVNQVNVGNKKAIITLKTATKLGFRLPKNLPAGTYDLSLYGSFGSMTEAKFFSVAKKKVTQVVAGFGGNSPALNEVVNAGISRTLARLGGGVTLVCNGSTSGVNVTKAAKELARDRARAACAEAKKANPSLTTKIRISPASAVGAQARNVKLVYRNY